MRTPFEIEERRDILAKEKKYKELKKLYASNLPAIPNFNTPSFWDKRNSEPINLKKENPMAHDKYHIVSKKLFSARKILNVGAGSGNLEEQYFAKHYTGSWYGIDISPKSVIALTKQFPKANFAKAPITKLPFKNKIFDAVTILDVLEHISPSQLFQSLEEVKRVLKVNGILLISVPLNEGLEEMVSHGKNPNAHVRVYTPEVLEAELTIAGFTILEKEYLYAFGAMYSLKTFIVKHVLTNYRKPNLIIITASL